MSQGLPIITTKTCVSGNEFVGLENGRLFDYGDNLKFQKYLLELLGDEKLRINMSINNYNKMKNYTFENMRTKFLEAISKEEVKNDK